MTRLGLGPREAGIAILAVGLGLFWLTDQLVRYAVPSVVDGTWQPFDDAWAFDLGAYVHAADRLVNDGSLYRAELVAGPFEAGSADLFMYPPPLGVAMLALREPPFREVALMWWAMHVAAMLLACSLMPVRPILRAVAFAVLAFSWPGVKDPVLGNVSTLLLPLLAVAWRWLDRPIGSVAIAISASVRPSLGILVLWQLLRRQWRAALWTVFAGGALFLGTLPFVGLDGYRDFVAVFSNLTPPTGVSENRDLGGIGIGLGAQSAVTTLVRMFSTLVAVSCHALGPATRPRTRLYGHPVRLTAAGAPTLGPLPGHDRASGHPSRTEMAPRVDLATAAVLAARHVGPARPRDHDPDAPVSGSHPERRCRAHLTGRPAGARAGT